MEVLNMEGNPTKASNYPICTGTSVVAVTFDNGVAIAADNRCSFGKMLRYRNMSRLFKANDNCLLGFGGDFADYQYMKTIVENKISELSCQDSDAVLSPLALHSYLTAVLYNRRSKMDPLWNTFVIGGVNGPQKKPYLGFVNYVGVSYTNPYIATGIGAYMIQQSLETAYQEKQNQGRGLTKDEAIELLTDSIQTLYVRDATGHNEFEIGLVTSEGCEILPVRRVDGNWASAKRVLGYEKLL